MAHYLLRIATIAITLIGAPALCRAQDGLPQRRPPLEIDLLAMSGSSTKLAGNGEGVVAARSSLLFKRGPTRVTAVDPAFKLNLPPGYSLYNNLSYAVESEAVVTGPHLVTLNLPSVRNKEDFDKLRILHAEQNEAEPGKPRWFDVTVLSDHYAYYTEVRRSFTKAEFEKLSPDFTTHTLRALSEDLGVFVVVVKDPSVTRDHFVADVGVTVTTKPEAVFEGRELEYSYTIKNAGLDSATEVRFHSNIGPYYISSSSSQGICRFAAGNIYCNLGEVVKGASVTVIVNAKCAWGSYLADRPEGQSLRTEYEVGAAEPDPNYENNSRFLDTPILRDLNKAPEVRILTPTEQQFFVGPSPSVKIIAEAQDPDGKVAKVELFDQGRSIGAGKQSENGRYEFTYRDLSYGWHWLTAIVTDDQGRENSTPTHINFLVNGQARVEVSSPKPNDLIPRSVGSIIVKVRASNPLGGIKRVAVSIFEQGGGGGGSVTEAIAVDKDVYEAKFATIPCMKRCRIEAGVTDNAGVETLSERVDFKLTDPPHVSLHRSDGQYAHKLENGMSVEASTGTGIIAKAISVYFGVEAIIAKVDFYANEKLICTDVNSKATHKYYPHGDFRCALSNLPPGKYTLVAVATDNDGVEGKSDAVEVVIR